LKAKPIVRKATPRYGREHVTNESAITNTAGINNPIKLKILRKFLLVKILFRIKISLNMPKLAVKVAHAI